MRVTFARFSLDEVKYFIDFIKQNIGKYKLN